MMRGLCLLLIGIVSVASGTVPVSARQASPAATPAEAVGLPETVWHLADVTLVDDTVVSIDDPPSYTIQFLSDGRVVARADCNQVSGDYTVGGDALTLSALVTTLLVCSEDSLGSDYTAWLEQVISFELSDDALILIRDDGVRLRFMPALVGVSWQWQRFEASNDTVTAPDNPADYMLRFEPGGRVLVRADCNTGSGRYTADGATITIRDLGLTRQDCGAGSLGNEYVQRLLEVASFTFSSGQLALALPVDAGILLFVARAEADAAATPEAG